MRPDDGAGGHEHWRGDLEPGRVDKLSIRSAGRWRCGLAALFVILAGLALRGFGYRIGLPFFVVKYGGSVLWGGMVFLLIAALTAWPRAGRLAVLALAVAVTVELSRLWHVPALDAFRLTLAGQLLLGRVFSCWNILAYAAGIGLAAVWHVRIFSPARGSAS